MVTGLPTSLKGYWSHLGHRHLSQHLSPGIDPAKPGILVPERHRLDKDEPHAEFPRSKVYQRP